ncbi:sigma-70 family RNA polymerase sigma factor [Flaviaesturariibacter amylovorans]|uniref:RNA polymerase sigma-70 region 2 domain-containing protein n=1 Tax=Flaviaesturariibacter amylovorans TaxID=1084520 RepID=A0ABP8G796_9BACT
MNKGSTIDTDIELLALLRDRRRAGEGIARLYATYAADMAALVQRHGGTYDDGQDVFQEVALAFVYSVQDGRYREESGIRTFLFAMTRNKWFNELRRRGRAQDRAAIFEQERDALPESATQLLEHKEASAGLQATLERLGAGCRELLTGFYYAERSMRELAADLGLGSEQVARNKKHRCLKKLSELIESEPALAQQLKNLLYAP